MKRIPDAQTPWSEVNRFLFADERFYWKTEHNEGYAFSPRDSYRLRALVSLCREKEIFWEGEWGEKPTLLNERLRSFSIDEELGVARVEGGCRLRDLFRALFARGYELNLSEDLSLTVSAAVERGEEETQLEGKAARSRFVGAQIAFSGSSVSEAPFSFRRLWVKKSPDELLIEASFSLAPLPEARIKCFWTFRDKNALRRQAEELIQFAQTWERLDSVESFYPQEKCFLLAQLSGSFSALRKFRLLCPQFSSAEEGDKARLLKKFFQEKGLHFRIESDASQAGGYRWTSLLTGVSWHITRS